MAIMRSFPGSIDAVDRGDFWPSGRGGGLFGRGGGWLGGRRGGPFGCGGGRSLTAVRTP
jgi:hypothetical protein